MTVTWQHPSADGGAEIVGYVLQVCGNLTNPWLSNSTTQLHVPLSEPVSEATISVLDLLPNTTYLLRACSLNSQGLGAWSATSAFQTAPAAPPTAPSDLQVVAADASSISLQWRSGVSPASALPVLSQQLEQDNWWLDQPLAPVYEGQATAFVAANLLPASTYTFRASSRNAAGFSNFRYLATLVMCSPCSLGSHYVVLNFVS